MQAESGFEDEGLIAYRARATRSTSSGSNQVCLIHARLNLDRPRRTVRRLERRDLSDFWYMSVWRSYSRYYRSYCQ